MKRILQCGIRKHTFWEHIVGDMLSYICEPQTWVRQIFAITYKGNAFDLHFILNRVVLLKWRTELVMSGQKIIMMNIEHMKFIDSVFFLPFTLRKLSRALFLTASKAWYPHYFKTEENLNYIVSNPDAYYYDVEDMNVGENRISRIVRQSGVRAI